MRVSYCQYQVEAPKGGCFLLSALPAIDLAQASQAGLSGKQKIKQVLSVLSVSAVKMNIKKAPF